jgi:hypothetical protein
MAQGDSPAEAAAAAGALWNLAANPRNQALIQAEGGVPVVVALFREGGNPGAQLAAAGALCNLLLRKEAHTAILAAGRQYPKYISRNYVLSDFLCATCRVRQ